jgi:hypothetical protein
MNILYLDNDECLGYFSLISGLYSETVCDYCLKLKLEEKNLDRINVEALFILFAADLLDMGFARPGLKDFFAELKRFKNKGYLDKIIMYTSAERYSKTEKNYVNWVGFMKNLFEFYSSNQNDNNDELFLIYDLDHSGRSDEIPRESPDGATLKSVEVPLKRLGITMENVKKIAFLDDRPQNIYIDGDSQQSKLKRVGVLPYYFLPSRDILKETCAKYDTDFMKLGMKSLSSIMDRQYDTELEEFKDNGYPIGIPYFDMSELEGKTNIERVDTPPPSIDISGEVNPIVNVQIVDADNISLDITKMLEKSASKDGESIDFSYELNNDNSDIKPILSMQTELSPELSLDFKPNQEINTNADIGISDFNLSEQSVNSILSSINISNHLDKEEKKPEIIESTIPKINLKSTKLYNEFITKKEEEKPKKIEFKDFSEEFGNKKENIVNIDNPDSSVINNLIDTFKNKQQIAGGNLVNKKELNYQHSILNDIVPSIINQNTINFKSNEINKSKIENFSIDISRDFNGGLPSIDISRDFNGGLPSIDISRELKGGLPSIDISRELKGGLPSIDIARELKGGLPSIDIARELKGGLPSIDIARELKGGLPSIDIARELKGGLPSIDIARELKGGLPSIDIARELKGGLPSMDMNQKINSALSSIDISHEFNGGLSSVDLSQNINSGLLSVDMPKTLNNQLPFIDVSNIVLNYD